MSEAAHGEVEDLTIKDEDRRSLPVGIRDRAMLAVLAYSGCRVGELVKLKVRDFRTNGEHRVLNVTGKGNKERTTPLHCAEILNRTSDDATLWDAINLFARYPQRVAIVETEQVVTGMGIYYGCPMCKG